MFTFFLKSYRVGLLDFCGSSVEVKFDPNGKDSKVSFKEFDNGVMKLDKLSSCHPNTLKGVIVGKKSWGLHVKMWSEGISDGDFRLCEITEDFDKRNIKIPEPLMNDLKNNIYKNASNKLKVY
jgi:hypothetical protein